MKPTKIEMSLLNIMLNEYHGNDTVTSYTPRIFKSFAIMSAAFSPTARAAEYVFAETFDGHIETSIFLVD